MRRRAPEPPPVSPRALALDVLTDVLGRRQPLEEAFANRVADAALAPRDRAFARLLLATTLRRLGQIDALIGGCLARPLPDQATVVRAILRLGVCQSVFLGTPAHAAVDTSVRLARARRQGRFLALVNAVLRRISRDGRAIADAQDATRLNTPDWLWQAWAKAFGAAVARAIATAHLSEPPLDLTLKPGAEATEQVLIERHGARRLATGTLRLAGAGPIAELPGYAAGDWWVQDAAAALPVRLLGPVAGRRIVDLCAAPGGKTAQLAAAGARVTAVDHAPERLARLGDNLVRLGLAAEIVTADAFEWQPPEPVDAVLVDAPCSATGTIRRHPDVVWHRTPADIANLAALQARLLAAAAGMLRPGGIVVYCACSLEPEEGPHQTAALVASGVPLMGEPMTPEMLSGEAALLDAHGALRTRPDQWPEVGGLDGFYAVRLRRTA